MTLEGRQKLYLGAFKLIARNQRRFVLHMVNLCSLVRRTRWSLVSKAFFKLMKTVVSKEKFFRRETRLTGRQEIVSV